MIKFFRRIRQNLLSENKFGKYLLYAIGEILLVIIGILIALQINNKNSERIEKKEFERILQYVLEDLEKDKLDFLALAKEKASLVEQAEFVLRAAKEGHTLTTTEIANNLRLLDLEDFHKNESGFERLFSSKLYESEAFFGARKKIKVYIDLINRYNDQEKFYIDFVGEMKAESLKKGSHLEFVELIKLIVRNSKLSEDQKTDISEFKIDFEKIVTNNPPMLAILMRGVITFTTLENLSSHVIKQGAEVKVEIEDYLNK